MSEEVPPVEWIVLRQTDSTNRAAKELARQGAGHGTVVMADCQTQGRGRLGRDFFSPEGGLYLSLILHPQLPMEQWGLLTPMAAVAVCRALEKQCGIRPGIKWVNDLYLEGKKLCGILCEGAGTALIAGIGMNLQRPKGGFPADLNAVALPVQTDREKLARAVAEELLTLCARLPDRSFLKGYRENSLVLGRQVTVHPVEGEPYPAVAAAIDDLGRLVVDRQGQMQTLDSGEVSIRF